MQSYHKGAVNRQRLINSRLFIPLRDYAAQEGISRQAANFRVLHSIPKERLYRDEYSGLWWVCVD